MTNQKPKKQLNKYIRLAGIGIQMGVTIYAGAYFGKWLDAKYSGEHQTYTIIFTLLAVVVSFYSLIKQIKDVNS
jgi:membrane protein DedA with SNARE-associated domain